MSSTYYAVCLAHDPAIFIAAGNAHREWNHPSEALAAVADRTGALGMHSTCDIVVTRESGALIEVCCPPPGNHAGMHREPQWVSVEWLRLMLAALESPTPVTTDAIEKFRNWCWNADRVRRLHSVLNPSYDEDTDTDA